MCLEQTAALRYPWFTLKHAHASALWHLTLTQCHLPDWQSTNIFIKKVYWGFSRKTIDRDNNTLMLIFFHRTEPQQLKNRVYVSCLLISLNRYFWRQKCSLEAIWFLLCILITWSRQVKHPVYQSYKPLLRQNKLDRLSQKSFFRLI